MNIFVLDLDPQTCAAYHCDKHLVKMIVEHCQILGSNAHLGNGISKKSEITPQYRWKNFRGFPRIDENQEPLPYGIGYKNHPCTQWARECIENHQWLCELTLEMCKEYTRRYGRKHRGEAICQWYKENPPHLPSKGGLTPFAQAMPDDCKNLDPVKAYRTYYLKYKTHFAKWNHSTTPQWFIDGI